MIPEELRYTKSHEWVRLEGDVATIGITDYAQEKLSDVVFVDLPQVGDSFAAGDVFGAAESTKHASDLYLPAAGEVVEVNTGLEDAPESVNESPYDKGWMVKIRLEDASQLDGLLAADGYKQHIESEA